MNLRLLDFLIDPNDGGTLEARCFEGSDEEIREGALVNPQSGRWYPVREGIPTVFCDDFRVGSMKEEDELFAEQYAAHSDVFDTAHLNGHHHEAHLNGSHLNGASRNGSSSHNHERGHDFKRMESERRARDEQAEDYDRMISMKILQRFEVPAYTRALSEYSSAPLHAPLLEAGCGTGRFTDLFAEFAGEVVAVDLSRDSILRNRVRHAGKLSSPVHYLHADLTHLPLRERSFGRIAHVGVYEHIPSRSMRRQFIEHAHRVLEPGGTLLLSAYRYGGLTKFFEKEGEHDGGIPFMRFTEEELRGEVEPDFDITHFISNLGVYMSMLVGEPLPTKAAVPELVVA
jgi:SAM-dependent methyltransferase/uncharacterized protein YbaR (Trm112 family)